MYHTNQQDLIFECHQRSSCYVMRVDAEQRLRFVTWTSRPATNSTPLFQGLKAPVQVSGGAQRHFAHFDELPAYGDESVRECAMALDIPELPVQAGMDAAHFPVRDVRLRYVSHRIGQPSQSRAGEPQHGRPTSEQGGDWLIIELANQAYPFVVEFCLRCSTDYDIIERYLVLHNRGDQTLNLRHAWAASLQLPFGDYQVTSLNGSWCAEFSRQTTPLPVGNTIFESRTLNSSLNAQSTVFLQQPGKASRLDGETFGCQLAWSGNWRVHIEASYDQSLRIHLGENPVDSQRSLEAGDSFATPLVLAGRSDHGEEGLRRSFTTFHQRRTLPLPLIDKPVLYNSWEATYFNLNLANQVELARKAAAIGVELFVVDDGWFGGRRHDRAGLGDWVVSKEVFPDGIMPLIDEVHKLGMKFGIWFEPEMVNPDSDLYRAHPDWVLHFPSTPRLEGRNQLILDFGNPAVVEHIFQQMTTFLDEHPVDFIKWDMNRSPNAPGSQAGEQIWRKHVEAVHSIIDRLLARYPQLSIQSCSSGGGRCDAAMLARCCQAWTSDNTDALDRITIQDGYSLTYPTSAMECWVTHTVNHQTHRNLSLDFRFAAAMRGVLGIGSSLEQLSDEELDAYRQWIAFYKNVRHLVQGGILHRAALPDIDDGLSVWQFTSHDASEAYVSAIHAGARVVANCHGYRLADLDPLATYEVRNHLGEDVVCATGSALMHIGLSGNDSGQDLAKHPGSNWHYHLKRVDSVAD